TVEAMPLSQNVEFIAVDEIQLCSDRERGHVFTQRLLHARGRCETMFLGSMAMAPLIRRLLPEAEIVSRERLSVLSYAGSKKLTRLPKRTAVVAFSADQVYAIAELIRRQRGGAAVVMGGLSPRTRNAQVALYQSGEVDFLVATDAIGMGLNMDVGHVAFAGLRKFDGRRSRYLAPPEVAQIAGRAGRFTRDGTFGVTGDCEEMDEELIDAVENHRFQPITGAQWRNSALDFDSLPALLRSLSAVPGREGLALSEEALDETVLKRLAADEDIGRLVRDRSRLFKLWDACQLPDFRKLSSDEHADMVRGVFHALASPHGRLGEDWIAPRFDDLDRDDGEIDHLSQRLAAIRTLSYVANRPGWLDRAEHWRERTRALEDRLSDQLHAKLTARFIDRRTSVLMRALNATEEVLAGVADDGAVTVEGQPVGKLIGLEFEPAKGASQLEDRALRNAAQRAVAPEVTRRLGKLAADGDEAFGVLPDGVVLWNGAIAGRISGGTLFAPRVRLVSELGPVAARERAARRLEAWLAAEAGRRFDGLKRLQTAMADGELRGLARGIAWRVSEAGGVIARTDVAADLSALSRQERRALRTLGIEIGAHSIWSRSALTPQAMVLAQAVASARCQWRAGPERLAECQAADPATLSAFGRRLAGGLAATVQDLERMAALLRAAGAETRKPRLSPENLAELGWSEHQAGRILAGLRRTRPPKAAIQPAPHRP
ncbi:MAG TPA: helicase-related protein, partial [Caulobacteraceae bacterium]